MTVYLVLRTEEEREMFGQIRSKSFASDADVLRTALWNLARQLDIDIAPDVFAHDKPARPVSEPLSLLEGA